VQNRQRFLRLRPNFLRGINLSSSDQAKKRERRSRDKQRRSRPDWYQLQFNFDLAGIHEFSARFIRRQAFEAASKSTKRLL
jgi:hypothetical protein